MQYLRIFIITPGNYFVKLLDSGAYLRESCGGLRLGTGAHVLAVQRGNKRLLRLESRLSQNSSTLKSNRY